MRGPSVASWCAAVLVLPGPPGRGPPGCLGGGGRRPRVPLRSRRPRRRLHLGCDGGRPSQPDGGWRLRGLAARLVAGRAMDRLRAREPRRRQAGPLHDERQRRGADARSRPARSPSAIRRGPPTAPGSPTRPAPHRAAPSGSSSWRPTARVGSSSRPRTNGDADRSPGVLAQRRADRVHLGSHRRLPRSVRDGHRGERGDAAYGQRLHRGQPDVVAGRLEDRRRELLRGGDVGHLGRGRCDALPNEPDPDAGGDGVRSRLVSLGGHDRVHGVRGRAGEHRRLDDERDRWGSDPRHDARRRGPVAGLATGAGLHDPRHDGPRPDPGDRGRRRRSARAAAPTRSRPARARIWSSAGARTIGWTGRMGETSSTGSRGPTSSVAGRRSTSSTAASGRTPARRAARARSGGRASSDGGPRRAGGSGRGPQPRPVQGSSPRPVSFPAPVRGGTVKRVPLGLSCVALAIAIAAACAPTDPPAPERRPARAAQAAPGLETLEHLIFIVQENRSFDHYFGTFPGADGIPMTRAGIPKPCIPDPILDHCSRPYPSPRQIQRGGPHDHPAAVTTLNDGRMNGFILAALRHERNCVTLRFERKCRPFVGPDLQPDLMSYHRRADIVNYWRYAETYLLQDRMFAPTDSWTLPAHLFLVSAWSAYCPDPDDPMSCRSDLDLMEPGQQHRYGDPPIYAWTDITYLLHREDVSLGLLRGARHLPDRQLRRARGEVGRHELRQEPAAGVHDGGREPPARQHQEPRPVPGGGTQREPPLGVLGGAGQSRERAPRVRLPHLVGHGVRDAPHQRRHERPGLGEHRHLPHVGRLGWLLRPRSTTAGRSQRLRVPGPGDRRSARG